MIIEDDPFIAMDLEDTFSEIGYDIIGPFADVDSGLASLRQTQPHIALLDYNLGRETSIPLAKALEKKNIPFVFLSGQVGSVILGHDIPCQDVIAKPFVPAQLANLVENLI